MSLTLLFFPLAQLIIEVSSGPKIRYLGELIYTLIVICNVMRNHLYYNVFDFNLCSYIDCNHRFACILSGFDVWSNIHQLIASEEWACMLLLLVYYLFIVGRCWDIELYNTMGLYITTTICKWKWREKESFFFKHGWFPQVTKYSGKILLMG